MEIYLSELLTSLSLLPIGMICVLGGETIGVGSKHVGNPHSHTYNLISDRYRILDDFPAEDYCDTYWIRYCSIDSARIAKQKLDNKSFYGKALHVTYAPECEEVEDVRKKLEHRKKRIQKTQGMMLCVWCNCKGAR